MPDAFLLSLSPFFCIPPFSPLFPFDIRMLYPQILPKAMGPIACSKCTYVRPSLSRTMSTYMEILLRAVDLEKASLFLSPLSPSRQFCSLFPLPSYVPGWPDRQNICPPLEFPSSLPSFFPCLPASLQVQFGRKSSFSIRPAGLQRKFSLSCMARGIFSNWRRRNPAGQIVSAAFWKEQFAPIYPLTYDTLYPSQSFLPSSLPRSRSFFSLLLSWLKGL